MDDLAEVHAALGAVGLQARSVTAIHRQRIPGRAAFRVDLEDGIVKARCVESAEAAAALVAHRRGIDPAFAPILHQVGRVLIEAWIDGRVVGSDATPVQIERAAVLLAGLNVRTGEAAPPETGRIVASLAEHVDAGLLSAAFAALAPKAAPQGLVHLDLCGENLVVDDAGALHVVDNERVSIGPLGFDLARTWYRWGLAPADWARFEATYRAQRAGAEPLAPFWELYTLAHSASLRLWANPARAGEPIARLRQWLGAKQSAGMVFLTAGKPRR